jgi:hypothetical protein
MANRTLDVICICGSLRKGSYNRMVMNALPGLAPAGMSLMEAPRSPNSRSTMPMCRKRADFPRRCRSSPTRCVLLTA